MLDGDAAAVNARQIQVVSYSNGKRVARYSRKQ
jgi:hypothetical protein